MGGPREEEEYPDEVEERLVNEEYKIWKKNTPFLYGADVVSVSPSTIDSISKQLQRRRHPSLSQLLTT